MPKRKEWYERKDYLDFQPSTAEEWGQRVWDAFQEQINRDGWDNSMGDHNI